jgi:hypothetical protein
MVVDKPSRQTMSAIWGMAAIWGPPTNTSRKHDYMNHCGSRGLRLLGMKIHHNAVSKSSKCDVSNYTNGRHDEFLHEKEHKERCPSNDECMDSSLTQQCL